ncbi:MAG: hypothetical protein EA368_13830 [Leptolyngbya sp. DLM2.Bin27]|nr:MAG: hypothetical protein EA368_13830 [Leptolyngbya sp. DLM2.Bin27]
MANDDPSNGNDKSSFQLVFEYFKDNNYYFLYVIAGILLALALGEQTTLGFISFHGSAEGKERWVLIGCALLFLLAGLILNLNLFSSRTRGAQPQKSSRETELSQVSENPIDKVQEQTENIPFLNQNLDLNPSKAVYINHQKALRSGRILSDWIEGKRVDFSRKVTQKIYTEFEDDTSSIEPEDFRKEINMLAEILIKNIRNAQPFSPQERGVILKEGRSFIYTKALEELKMMLFEAAKMNFQGDATVDELLEFFSNQLIEDISA